MGGSGRRSEWRRAGPLQARGHHSLPVRALSNPAIKNLVGHPAAILLLPFLLFPLFLLPLMKFSRLLTLNAPLARRLTVRVSLTITRLPIPAPT